MSAESVTLIAMRPIVLTDLRTKSISTSVEYLEPSSPVIVSAQKQHSLGEFRKNGLGIFCTRQTIHDFKLGQFDINRVVVFAEEHFNIIFEHCRSSLNDEENIPESNILHLRPRRQ